MNSADAIFEFLRALAPRRGQRHRLDQLFQGHAQVGIGKHDPGTHLVGHALDRLGAHPDRAPIFDVDRRDAAAQVDAAAARLDQLRQAVGDHLAAAVRVVGRAGEGNGWPAGVQRRARARDGGSP